MKRAGFTLIEILIVVGIIVIMLASAVMSVASGRGAVRVKEATRGVIQLSRYASALALLRQRPVVITFHKKGKVEVRISGESTGSEDVGQPADPIYREVDGQSTVTAEEMAEESKEDEEERKASEKAKRDGDGAGGEKDGDKDGEGKKLFYTRQVLDPAVLAKEDAEGEYEGVTLTVEVLGEDGEPLEPEIAAMRSLRQPKRERNAEGGELPAGTEGSEAEEEDDPPVSITYEPNGSVNPHRIIVRLEGESEAEEGFAINISRSGKATVGDDEEEGGGKRGRGRRRSSQKLRR